MTWVTAESSIPSACAPHRAGVGAAGAGCILFRTLGRKDGECFERARACGSWAAVRCGAFFFVVAKGETASDRGGCVRDIECCEEEFVNVLCCAVHVRT